MPKPTGQPQKDWYEGLVDSAPQFFKVTEFGGINTKSPRMSIDDNEFSWLENYFPIGNGNLRTMWGKGTSKYTASGGRSIVMLSFFHLANTGYGIAVLDNGTAVQFNTSSGATTTVTAIVNAFYNGGNLPVIVPYGASGVLILSNTTANGYYAWDGTTLYKAGDTAPLWLSGLTAPIVLTGTTHTNTTLDGIASTATLQVGMSVSGTGIPANTTIASITSTTAIVLSQAATGSTTASFTFNWFMPSGLSGTAMEVFQNRVWTANNNIVTFSAAGNGTGFSAAIGGGSFTFTDSFMQTVTALKQANGYLYVFGDSGINYIGNVQTTVANNTVTTTFNNLNTDPQVGTPWPNSVIPFGRALMLGNTSGIYAMFGGSAEKVSDKLDGLFSTATLTLSGVTNVPCGAVATVFGIRLFFLLVTAVDPFTTQSRPILCTWDGNKWFISSQEVNFTYIATAEINSVLTAWGTDGTNVYPLFNQMSSTLTKKYKSKLWSGKSHLLVKQELRVYFEGFDNSGSGYNLTANIDTDQGSSNSTTVSGGGTVTWYSLNIVSSVVTWTSATGAVMWTVPGIGIQGANIDSVYGKLMGFTATSTSSDFTLVETNILYRDYNFYG